MEHTISNLLKAYEGGKLHRRELVKGLALLAAASSTASAASFPATGIHHISLSVNDLEKTGEFYAKAFAAKAVKRPDGTVAVQVGKGRLVLRKGSPAARVDHIAIGFENFNKDGIIAEMKTRGTPATEGAGAGLHIVDPDGYPVQLSDSAA